MRKYFMAGLCIEILKANDAASRPFGAADYGGVSFRSKRSHNSLTVPLAAMMDNTRTGSLIGVVKSVSQYPISAEGVRKGLGNAQLARYVKTNPRNPLIRRISGISRIGPGMLHASISSVYPYKTAKKQA